MSLFNNGPAMIDSKINPMHLKSVRDTMVTVSDKASDKASDKTESKDFQITRKRAGQSLFKTLKEHDTTKKNVVRLNPQSREIKTRDHYTQETYVDYEFFTNIIPYIFDNTICEKIKSELKELVNKENGLPSERNVDNLTDKPGLYLFKICSYETYQKLIDEPINDLYKVVFTTNLEKLISSINALLSTKEISKKQ